MQTFRKRRAGLSATAGLSCYEEVGLAYQHLENVLMLMLLLSQNILFSIGILCRPLATYYPAPQIQLLDFGAL